MPENNVNNIVREYALNSDQNLLALYKRIAYAYGTIELADGKKYGPGLLSEQEIQDIQEMDSVSAIQEMFAVKDLPNLTENQRLEFCDIFVGDDMDNFHGATPAILAGAYRAIRERAKEDSVQRGRLEKLAAYIDRESLDFANSNGMVIGNRVVDIVNVADVYAGFMDMLNARREDLDETADAGKIAQIDANIAYMESVIGEYDKNWGLDKLSPSNAKKLGKRWDKLWGDASRADMLPDTKNIAKKFKFLDENNQEIPQFLSDGRVDKNGRLAAVWHASCIDTTKRHVAKTDEAVDANALELEINQDVLFKLQAMTTTSDAINLSVEDIDELNDIKAREEAIKDIEAQKPFGGTISNDTYNAAMDVYANDNAAWGARVKNKVGRFASRVRGFFGKYTRATEKIDALSDTRMGREATTKRKKRIQLFGGVLKGVASGFVASALITTIATAAAAATGMTMASALAMIGGTLALGIIASQLLRWRREQKEAGKPVTFREFRKNRQLITSIAISAVASAAMGLAAGGFATAAMLVGGVAMGAGMVNNGMTTSERLKNYKDMSKAERIAWVVANATAPLAGGIAGRFAANSFVNWYNQQNPENTLFQNKRTYTEMRDATREVEHSKTVTDYTDDMLKNSERAVKMWYRDNPELLEQRVAEIKAYGEANGIDVDPYRILRIIGLAGERTPDDMLLHVNNSHLDPTINDVHSHGMHGSYNAPGWMKTYGYTPEQIDVLAHTFNPDGSINPEGMNLAVDFDLNHLGTKGTIGYIEGRGYHNDNFLSQTDIARGTETSPNGRVHSVFSPIDEHPTQHTETWTETEHYTQNVDVTEFNRANTNAGLNAFGNYTRGDRRTLRNRLGAFLGRVRGEQTKVTPQDTKHDDVIVPVFDEEEKPIRAIVPAHDDAEQEIVDAEYNQEPRALLQPHGGELVPVVGHKLPKLEDVIGQKEKDFVLDTPKPKLLEAGRKQQQERVLRFGLTYQQAKNYNDLVQNIERETRKKNFDPKKITRWKQELQELYNKYGRPDSIEYEIARNEAYAREEIDAKLLPQLDGIQAQIRIISSEMADIMQQRPNVDVNEPHAMEKWQKKYDKKARKLDSLRKQEAKVENKIKELGGLALLDTSDLYFPSPVQSESRKRKEDKWARLDAEKAERDANAAVKAEMARAEREIREQERIAAHQKAEEESKQRETESVQPEIINPFEIENTHEGSPSIDDVTPSAFVGKVPLPTWPVASEHVPFVILDTPQEQEAKANKSITNRIDKEMPPVETIPTPLEFRPEITKIRGVSVNLVPVGENGAYIAQNNGIAVVLVNVDGVHVPFYLNEKDHMWRPIYRFNRNGKLYLGDSVKQYHPAEIIQIAGALGSELGTEFFVESLPQLDIDNVADAVLEPINNKQAYGLYAGSAIYADTGILQRVLSNVGMQEPEKNNLLRRWLGHHGMNDGHK